jgi:hypothetical protein
MNYKQALIEFKEIIERSWSDFQRFKTNFFKPIEKISYYSLISDYPIHTRNEILWLIKYCHKINLEIREMEIEFYENFQEIDEFIKENKNLYLIHMNNNISFYLDNFHPYQLFIDEYEFDFILGNRTNFEDILTEMSLHRNINCELEKIRLQDDIFRKLIPDLIRIHFYSPNDNIYAPENYWWLHLEEFYGPNYIEIKPTKKTRVYDIQRWYDPFQNNRNRWDYELYPNPGPKPYGKNSIRGDYDLSTNIP